MERLVSGTVGINKISNFDISDLPCKIAGQIPNKDHDPEGGLNIDDWIEPIIRDRSFYSLWSYICNSSSRILDGNHKLKFKKIEQE